jgi:hypothetical protein
VKYDEQVRAKIPENLLPLMAPHLEKIDSMLSPGLVLLRWTSLNLSHFANSVTSSLESLELLIDRARDILSIQIQGVLNTITSTLLCDLPENDPWPIEEFVSRIKVRYSSVTVCVHPYLQVCSLSHCSWLADLYSSTSNKVVIHNVVPKGNGWAGAPLFS